MIQCAKCKAKAPQSDGRWASVLREEPGSIPDIVCPRCAAEISKGIEIDPVTKERTTRAFKSTLSRF